jgi:hypothetical protein
MELVLDGVLLDGTFDEYRWVTHPVTLKCYYKHQDSSRKRAGT